MLSIQLGGIVMKRIAWILTIFALSFILFQQPTYAKNSPTSNYTIYLTKNVPYYSKVNGKKLGTVKNHFIVSGEYKINKITLIKLQNSKWAKIHFKTTNSSKNKKYGYIHAKNIHANDLSLNYGITKKPQSKIYLKASKYAKVQKELPAGTRVKVIHGVGNGNGIWYKVKVTTKRKSTIGYMTGASLYI